MIAVLLCRHGSNVDNNPPPIALLIAVSRVIFIYCRIIAVADAGVITHSVLYHQRAIVALTLSCLAMVVVVKDDVAA